MALTQSTRIAILSTPLGGDTLVFHSLSISEELGRLFSLDIEAGSERGDLEADDLLGKAVSVEMKCPRGGTRYFHGFVSRFSRIPRPGTRYFAYRLSAVPWLWFLTLHSDCRIFQNKTLQDILRDVFGRRGFSDFKFQLSGDYTPWEYCVQYRETDFNFVSRLLEQEGAYYYFEHEKDKHTAVFADSPAAHQPFPKYEKLTFSALTSIHEHDQEHVYDWVAESRHHTGKYQHTDYYFATPSADLKTPESNPGNFAHSDFEIFDYPGEYNQRSDGEQWSRIRMEELRADRETFQGGGDVTGLATGRKFTLSQGPSPADVGEYLVIASSIQLQSNIYESGTTGALGESYHCTFTAIQAADQFRPARLTPKPVIQGVQTAVVSGPKGEEIYTDKYGRIKVQFHWDREGKHDENTSCFMRVATSWAGQNWGAIRLPRIGQEVVVGFLEGDPDQPLVVGSVYNGKQMPPYELPANKTQSGVKSRSSLGGAPANFNEIRFEDKKGSEQVYIHAEKNQDNVVENDETTQVGHDRTENVGHDEKITIGHDRTEHVGHDEKITVDSNRTRYVTKTELVTVALMRTHNVGINEMINVGGAQEITVGGARAVTVLGAQVVSIGLKLSEKIVKDHSHTVGKKLNVDAGEEISLKSGAASITLKKDGSIAIEGTEITIKGKASIDLNAPIATIN